MEHDDKSHGDHQNGQINKPLKFAEKDFIPGHNDLWTDGLLCAFEFIRVHRRPLSSKSASKTSNRQNGIAEDVASPVFKRNKLSTSVSATDLNQTQIAPLDEYNNKSDQFQSLERHEGSHWVPIGWSRISELIQMVQSNTDWGPHPLEELMDGEEDLTVADLAAPYWERPAGPTWWCHLAAGHPSVGDWLAKVQCLHPAVSLALKDESRLISERMKHLLYEVPVRVAGGLLFEILGQSAGDPFVDEDDIPIVVRSWQAQNFLITVLHLKGRVQIPNVLGIMEVQELLYAGGYNTPRTVHEVIALLTCRLSRWDDRLFRKSIFGAADEIELKFMNRRNYEDMHLFSIILNQEIRKLSRQVSVYCASVHTYEIDCKMPLAF
ncbi:hypothetical protein ACFE04_015612 [Oxalis oulophora]